ncbi:MAG: PAS domain S-box protein [Candidatus Pacebacteria bacterium]|jgi:PAS domain S-box-containing protein|nr:PAS domain S-box protein [Candidatus Paceibacterota bacterium]
MTLKNKFNLSSVMSIGLVVMLVLVLMKSTAELAEQNEQRSRSRQVLQNVSELDIVMYQYADHPTPAGRAEWKKKYDELGKVLELLRKDKDENENRIIGSLASNYRITGALFANLADFDKLPEDQFIRSQEMVRDASLLAEENVSDMLSSVYLGVYLALLIGVLLLLNSTIATSSVFQIITRSLRSFRFGMEEVGRGNFHYVMDIKNNDELGQAAAGFNEMTKHLLAITASKSELEKEVVERKHAEEELRKLTSAVEQSPASIVITDTMGNIEYVNPGFVKTTGYSFEEAKGENPRILKSGHFKREQYEDMWNTIIAGGEWKGEFHNRKKNGDMYWESAVISPVKNSKGIITNFIAVKEDITERKQAEERLKNFISILSHEIRNPLAPILTEVELLKMRGGSDLELKESIAIIERQVNTMARLLKDLLDVSRIERGKIKLSMSEVNVSEMIQNAMETANPLIVGSKQHVSFSEPEEPIIIWSDPLRIEQIITNLLNNASKYSNEYGNIEISLQKTTEHAMIKIKDDGIGIPQETLESIFEIFAQNETMGRIKGGLGVGLHLSREFARILGGSISVKSEGKGKGSEFTLRVPLTRSEA